jgi:hypothetical protein
MVASGVHEQLQEWAEAGLLSPAQAATIDAYETRRDVDRAHPLPRWVEPVSYLGVTLVALALLLFGIQVWDQLSAWGHVGLTAFITVVLLLAGRALGRAREPAARRAGAVAWLVATAAGAAAAGLTAYELLDLDDDTALMLTSAVAVAVAASLYAAARTSLQQVGLAASLVLAVSSVADVLPIDPAPWSIGLVLFLLGAVWMLLTRAGLLLPSVTGWTIGGLFTLAIGLGTTDGAVAVWAALGIGVGLGLVYLSTVLETRLLLAVGVIGLVVWIPTTVVVLFEGSVVVPIAILLTGLVTLVVVVVAVRAGQGRERVDA